MLLLVVEDRHGEPALREALASAARSGDRAVVLTSDALLAMRLRRERIDTRLTVDGIGHQLDARDRMALDGVAAAFGDRAVIDGTNLGPFLHYTLIPTFMRAVRNITAVQDTLDGVDRVVFVGGGALVEAARLVARSRRVPATRVGGD